MRNNQRGAALIVIMAGMSLILLVLLTGLTMTSFSGRTLHRQLTYQGQAMNAASAGLQEALSWFQRQAAQPVTNFDPVLDVNGVCTHTPTHVPAVNDSDDPALGLVREYELSALGSLRARYEVTRTAVSDQSQERGKAATDDGTVWHLLSEGIVYVDNGAATFNAAPNVVLARRRMETDIQRLQIRPPGDAALYVTHGGRVSVNSSVRIRGNTGVAAAWRSGTGNPTFLAGVVTGSQGPVSAATVLPDIQSVFGITQQELLATADVVVPNVASLPPVMPAMGLVVINGNATFGPPPGRRMQGSGILVILGNLTIAAQSLSSFSGIVYVAGTVNIAEPTTINGCLIVAPPPSASPSGPGPTFTYPAANPFVTLTGSADVVELNYDASILNQIRQQMGNYRFTRSFYMVGR